MSFLGGEEAKPWGVAQALDAQVRAASVDVNGSDPLKAPALFLKWQTFAGEWSAWYATWNGSPTAMFGITGLRLPEFKNFEARYASLLTELKAAGIQTIAIVPDTRSLACKWADGAGKGLPPWLLPAGLLLGAIFLLPSLASATVALRSLRR